MPSQTPSTFLEKKAKQALKDFIEITSKTSI
jgi:hypothetical protein